MLSTRTRPRVRWTTRRTDSGSLSITITVQPRNRQDPTVALRAATTAPSLVPELRAIGLSFGDIGLCVGSLRGRVWEWQKGVVGVGRGRWARLTALRDVAITLLDAGRSDVRGWLFAYHPDLDACPYQRIAADQFGLVLAAASRATQAKS